MLASTAQAPEATHQPDYFAKHQRKVREYIHMERIDTYDFSERNLRLMLSLLQVKHKEIVIAQAKLETGNFTSPIFRESNNLFGMKHPRVRQTTSLGSHRGHAYYHHWTDSVRDYVMWLQYYQQRGYCTRDYIAFITAIGYAEDPYYIDKIFIIKKENTLWT